MSGTIEVEGLTKSFGSFTAVDDVSFQAADGALTALLGPSGSGKSTVLRMIAGLERPTAGRVTLAGEEVTDASVQERRVGFVFQHYALFRHMTVRENVAFGLRVRKGARDLVGRRVNELLELVQLGPFAGRYPHHLSGGQRQRVALARALAPRPKVLLLDEPFGALDARVRQELRRWLDELHRELGVTSLLVTHDQEEALELAGEVVVMNRGRVEQIGTPDHVYNAPASPFVAGFVGAANVLEGRVRGGRAVLGGDGGPSEPTDLPEGTPVLAYVRPHQVLIGPAPGGERAVPATVDRSSSVGWATKVSIRLSGGQSLIAVVPKEEPRPWEWGEPVCVELREVKVFARSALAPEAVALDGRPDEEGGDPGTASLVEAS